MADFVSVLNRAIETTGAATPEARKALYDKARAALVRQLESRDPPLSAEQLADQTAALDRAVSEVEAKFAAPAPATREPAEPLLDEADDALPEPDEQAPADVTPQSAATLPPRPGSASLPPKPGDAASADAGVRPSPPPRANPIKTPPPDEKPSGPISSATSSQHGAFRAAVNESARLGEASSRTGDDARARRDVVAPPSRDEEDDEIASIVQQVEEAEAQRAAPGYGEAAYDKETADGDVEEAAAPSRSRGWLWLALILLVLAGAGAGAWTQRDAINRWVADITGGQAPGSGEQPAKNEDRIGDQPAEPPASQQQAEQPAPATDQPTEPTTGEPAATQAALIEENVDDPSQAQIVDGTVNWSTRADGELPIIEATAEFPDRKMTMALTIRKNTDTSLPASHVIEVLFTVPEDFPAGGVSNVPGLLMKATPQAQGAPLAGESVRVTNGYFWIGLSNADVELKRNLQELKSRGFIDIPLVYDNGRRGILSLAKGPDGEAAFSEAFAAWGE